MLLLSLLSSQGIHVSKIAPLNPNISIHSPSPSFNCLSLLGEDSYVRTYSNSSPFRAVPKPDARLPDYRYVPGLLLQVSGLTSDDDGQMCVSDPQGRFVHGRGRNRQKYSKGKVQQFNVSLSISLSTEDR